MSWRTRAVLAATAGAGLVGAGALTAAYAVGSVPTPAPSSLTSSPSHDPQVDALTQEAQDLQGKVAELEQAVTDEPAPTQAPATAASSTPSTAPSSAPSFTPEPDEPSASAPAAAPTAEPSHHTEHEVEVGESDHGGQDD